MKDYQMKGDRRGPNAWAAVVAIVAIIVVAVILYFVLRPAPVTAPVDQTHQGTTQSDSGSATVGKKVTDGYTDETHGFSFAHVADMTVAGPKAGDTFTTTWRNNTQTLGLVLAKGTIAKSAYPKTNFSEGTFTVGESNDPDAISSCLVAQNGETAGMDTMINGVNFHSFTLGDAGAGNFYDTTSYRTLHNGRCFSVEYTIHSTSLGAYDPSQGISQFDRASVTADLQTSALSFAFAPTDASDLSALVGKWTGVEGTSLTISTTSTGYDLNFVMLDGPVLAKGTGQGDAISFKRADKSFVLFRGTGDDTGMKYLLGKKNCIVVAPYEGYCKS